MKLLKHSQQGDIQKISEYIDCYEPEYQRVVLVLEHKQRYCLEIENYSYYSRQ